MSETGSGRVPTAPGSCRSGDAADASSSLRDGDPSRAVAPYSALEIAGLIEECRGWHDALDAPNTGGIVVTIRCEDGGGEQARLNLRAMLRDVGTVLAGIVFASAPAMEAAEGGRDPLGLDPKDNSAVREAKALKNPSPLTEGDTPIPLPDPLARITTDPHLLEALKRAAAHEMTPAELHAQRRSWIIGEMGIEHPELSREQLEALADHAVGPAPAPSPDPGAPQPSTPTVGE